MNLEAAKEFKCEQGGYKPLRGTLANLKKTYRITVEPIYILDNNEVCIKSFNGVMVSRIKVVDMVQYPEKEDEGLLFKNKYGNVFAFNKELCEFQVVWIRCADNAYVLNVDFAE